jgi:acyl carrier protein
VGDELSSDDSLVDQGIIDSTGVLELVTYLEETYGIKVEDEELIPDNLDSINRLVSYLERKLQLSR